MRARIGSVSLARRRLAAQAVPLCVAAAAFIVAVGLPAADPDMWWHLASGRWMAEHREALRVDIWSTTATGTPYDVGAWLGQLALYAAYAAAGWPGIAVLRAALVALTAFSLTRVVLRAAPAAFAIPLVALALALSHIVWTERPQLFSLALFAVTFDLLFTARAGATRALWAVPPLLFLWSDLHGGYGLGVVLAALFAADAYLTRRAAGPFALAAATSVVVVTLNPGALGLIPSAGHLTLLTLPASPVIQEELSPDVLTPAGLVFALFVVATVLALLRGGAPPLAAFLLPPLLLLALSAQRHLPFFVFAAVPFLSAAASSALGTRAALPALTLRYRWPLAPGLAVALWAGAIASIATAPSRPNEATYPSGALDALRASRGVLLNEYDWGGYLIWRAPERPVFVDSRFRPYPPEVLRDLTEVLELGPGWRRVLDRHSVRQVLLRPERPAVDALREDGWRVVAEGATFVLLERPG